MSIYTVGEVWKKILPHEDGIFDHERPFFSRVLDIANTANRILEVGLGRGRMVYLLKESSGNNRLEFYGIDLNSLCRFNDIHFTNADARNIPFRSNAFCLTYSLGVIEHMPSIQTTLAIKEHIRVTRSGGYILITVPGQSPISTPLRRIVYWAKFRGLGTFEEVLGRNMTEVELLNPFVQEGCSILEAGRSGIYIPKLPLRLKRAALRLVPDAVKAYIWVLARKP